MEEIKYRREDEMKDSGIEWLGKIPKEWEVKKLKYIFESVKNGIWGDDEKGDENDVFCIRVTNFNRDKSIVEMDNLTVRNLDKYKQKDYLLKKNDLLIEKSGGGDNQPVGFVAIYNSNVPAIYANFMARIVINQKNDNRYILYYLSTLYNKRINTKHINQTTGIQNINTTSYFDEKIGIPKILEQEKIANFLDIKTSQFDSIISKKEKLIEKLEEAKKSLISEVVTGKVKIVDGEIVERKADEMKDSGVEWLGMIPKDWEVKRLKYLAECYPSNVDKKSRPGEKEVKLCNYTDVYYNDFIIDELDFMKATASDSQIIKYSLNKGDIVLTKDSESPDDIGVASYVDECIDNLVCGYHLTIVKMHKKYYSLYFYYLLQTAGVKNYFGTVANGITRFGIGVSGFKDLIVCIPSNKEQREISKYLRQQIEKNTTIINKTKTQIQKLKEAKESLISEAVTGKIDLRDWEIREVDES